MNKDGISFKFNKSDIFLVTALFVIAIALLGVIFITNSLSKEGTTVVAEVNNQTVCEFSLSEDISYDIVTEYGRNTLIIKDGRASVSFADCPDGICAAHVPIYKEGEEIICIPHKLVIRIKSAE